MGPLGELKDILASICEGMARVEQQNRELAEQMPKTLPTAPPQSAAKGMPDAEVFNIPTRLPEPELPELPARLPTSTPLLPDKLPEPAAAYRPDIQERLPSDGMHACRRSPLGSQSRSCHNFRPVCRTLWPQSCRPVCRTLHPPRYRTGCRRCLTQSCRNSCPILALGPPTVRRRRRPGHRPPTRAVF